MLSGTYLSIKKNLPNDLNHRISGCTLLEIIYRGFNVNNNVVTDMVIGGAFMRSPWDQVFEILDGITKTNGGWHTHKANVPTETYLIEASIKHRAFNNSVAQEVAQLRMDLSKFTKKIVEHAQKS